MALPRPNSLLPDDPELSPVPSRNAVSVKLPAPRFVTFRLKDTDKTMRNVSPFFIQKALDGIAGSDQPLTFGTRMGHSSWRRGMKNNQRFS
jgi:hypothetical protein